MEQTITLRTDDKVCTPCAAYDEMACTWELIDALLGGTRAMRDGSTDWLPMEPGEVEENYVVRLRRTVLFPGYSDAVRKLSSKPFERPVTLANGNSLPELLKAIELDADSAKTPLTRFAGKVWHDAINRGLTHVLVDFPERDKPTTTADVQSGEVHPYFVHVPAESVIGWKSEIDQRTRRRVLSQVRILEVQETSGSEWTQESTRFVRVIERDRIQLWQESTQKKDLFTLVKETPNELGEIPLVTVYFNQTGFMTAEPPLENLAWLNLKHWQVSSDHSNILHIASVPFLSETGVASNKLNEKFVLAAGRVHRSSRSKTEYGIGWVEHTGASVKAGSDEQRNLEEQMQLLGMQPMLDPSSPRTATEAGATRDENHTTLKDWAQRLKQGLYECYAMAARYGEGAAKTLPEKFDVNVFTEWQLSSGDAAGMDRIDRMFDRGVISKKRYALEAERRGLFGEDFDFEKEQQEIADEAPPQPTPEQMLELERLRLARNGAQPPAGSVVSGAA